MSDCSNENMTGWQRKLSKMIRTKWNVNQELVLVLTWAGEETVVASDEHKVFY